MTPAEKRRRSFRDFAAITTAVIGLAIAVPAGYLGLTATLDNQSDIRETNAAQLDSCQQRNRNALQNAVNTLVIVDGVLERFDVPVTGRRIAAAASVDALGKETQTGGSVGPRDCDADGRITASDYPVGGYPPEPLIDADTGLPRRPPPTSRPTPGGTTP